MLKVYEQVVLRWTGKIIMLIGVVGFVLTSFFDKLAGRLSVELGSLQILGLVVFFLIFLFGERVDVFLRDIDEFLNN